MLGKQGQRCVRDVCAAVVWKARGAFPPDNPTAGNKPALHIQGCWPAIVAKYQNGQEHGLKGSRQLPIALIRYVANRKAGEAQSTQ